MRIETTRFGVLDLEESVFIHFPWGIPGFEETKRYVLFEHRQGPFQWLQAVDDPEVAFVVCPPEVFGIRYRVPEDKRAAIGVSPGEEIGVLVIVSFNRGDVSIRPHRQGPLLFNVNTRQASQWFIEARELEKFIENVDQPVAAGKPTLSGNKQYN